MTNSSQQPRFTVVTTQTKRSRGSETHRLVMNDRRRRGLVVHATVSRSLDGDERHLRLEHLEIRLADGARGSSHDAVHLLGDPQWIRTLLRAIAAHFNVDMDPRDIDPQAPGEGGEGTLRSLWRALQSGGQRQQTAPLPPLPAITDEMVDQLMEEIDTFLAQAPDQKPGPESE